MAVTLRGSTTATTFGPGTLTLSVPAGTSSGDVLVFGVCVTGSSALPTAPSGVTLLDSASSGPSFATYYRVCDGTETSFGFTVANISAGTCRCYSGVSNSGIGGVLEPINAHSAPNRSTTSTATATSITTTNNNCMLVFLAGDGSTQSSFTNPTGFGNQAFAGRTGIGCVSCDEIQSSSGATGSVSGTWGGTGNNYSSLIALTPGPTFLSASPGAMSITSDPLTLPHDRHITATAPSINVTGKALVSSMVRVLTAGAGSASIAGKSASLTPGTTVQGNKVGLLSAIPLLPSELGVATQGEPNVSLNPQSASPLSMPSSAGGGLSLTPVTPGSLNSPSASVFELDVSPGVMAVTGNPTTLVPVGGKASYSLSALKGSVAVTGNAATFGTATANGIYWGSWIDGPTLRTYYGGTYQTVPFDTGAASQTKFETDAGKTMSLIHFGNGDSGSAGFWTVASRTGDLDVCYNRNCYPVLDISTGTSKLTDVTAGNFDSAMTTWFNNIKNWGKPVILRLNWEMQGTWFPWGFTSPQDTSSRATHQTNYINAWQHIVTLCNTTLGLTNVSWFWCPNYVLTSTTATQMQGYYPGDAYVDWAGFDVYQDDAKVADGNSQGSYTALSNLTYTTIVGFTSKPQMIGEWGCWEFSTNTKGGPSTKGAWLQDAFSVIQNSQSKIRGIIYFNWNSATGSTNAIESSTDSLNGFKTGVSSNYFKPKLASLNTTGKVPVP